MCTLQSNENYHTDDIFVTQLYTSTTLQEYINDETVEKTFNDTISNFSVGKDTKLGRNLHAMLKRYSINLKELVPILFSDCYDFFNGEDNFEETIENFQIWKHIYSFIHETTKSKMFFEAFMDILPYILTYTVTDFYDAINQQIIDKFEIPRTIAYEPCAPEKRGTSLLQIPLREEIGERVVFLFTTITPLKSFIRKKMNMLFGPDTVKRPPFVDKSTEPSILLPIEDKEIFDEFSPYSMYSVNKFYCRSTSHIMTSRASDRKQKLSLNYPSKTDNFDTLTQGVPAKDSGVKAFLKKSVQPDVTAQLRDVSMSCSTRTTKIIHKERQEQNSIKTKRNIVLNSSQEKREVFIKQMKENQSQGIYMEDPAITIELLNNKYHHLSEEIEKNKKTKSIKSFVDQIISQTQTKSKNIEVCEEHLTPEMRYKTLDIKELLK